jgi:lipid-A-disaccharide synthase
LNDDANRRTLTEIFTDMHIALRQNTSQKAAEAVARVLETRRPR